MTVHKAIKRAEAILPGVAAPDGEMDERWQRIIDIGQYIESDPEPVWEFVGRWGGHQDEDLRMAVATCLLEHLLGKHFDSIFPRVEQRVLADPVFAETFCVCYKMRQSELPQNEARWDALIERISGPSPA
jgi:hypothetical protein